MSEDRPRGVPAADAALGCPECGREGRTVSSSTLDALLTQAARMRRGDGAYRFCASRDCGVAYYGRSGARFAVEDVVGVIFQKSDDPSRLACYCFGHTVRSIELDASRTEGSTILERIVASCRAGLDDCARRNPQGRCCLGNVRGVAEAARRRATQVAPRDEQLVAPCPGCAPTSTRSEEP
jgi:hypothetical protein